MRALLMLLLIPALMWLSQSLLLRLAGRPLKLRISSADLPRTYKQLNRVATNLIFVAALLCFPLLVGQTPLTYYSRFFPLGARPAEAAWGAAAAVLYLALLYLAWLLSGNVRFEMRRRAGKVAKRLALAPLTAVGAACVEELLFRAVLLADLLRDFEPAPAVALGAAIFGGAHYVRGVKRYWTIGGHLALGVLLCGAFVLTEQSCWLALGVHAGGILVLMGVRPFVRYAGSPWLIGASIFPYAGVVGVVALLLLLANLILRFGSLS